MSKWRKKPVVIEAEQYIDLHGANSPFLKEALCFKPHNGIYGGVHIHTLEGKHQVRNTDWVIKGIKGEFYNCKIDIFEATYEKV
ncbi:MAG: hypothetical protein AABY22_18235 [Nanoarchaeota archaeon]